MSLEIYWNDIPIGKENAITYDELCVMWECSNREARAILHELSAYDNGDDFILIRSGGCRGFYKTDDEAVIKAYKKECLNKGRSVFAPVKKINRVLNADISQYSFDNNMRVVRVGKGLKQRQIVKAMKKYDPNFDISLLSKMENSVCMPTYYQLSKLALVMGCEPSELITGQLYY